MARRELTPSEEALELLSKPKRDRSWEAEARERQGQVTYRGVPKELHEEIKALAGKLGVNVGDIARAFLEHGLESYHAGKLELEPVVVETKKTLYPER